MIPKHEINARITALIQLNPQSRPFEITDMILPQVEISRVAAYDRVLRMRDQLKADAEKEIPGRDDVDTTLLKVLKTRRTLIDVANALDVSPQNAEERIGKLQGLGYNIQLDEMGAELVRQADPSQFRELNISNYVEGGWQKVGLVSDTHLACKYQRLDVLNALYDIFEREGIEKVYHTGNWVDGECRFNRFDLIVPAGVDTQLDYMIQHYPARKGVTTYYIDGDDHEGWWYQREGMVPGKILEDRAKTAGRTDLVFLGYLEASVYYEAPKGQTEVRLFHPKSGTGYAISYQCQKIIESLQGGQKPQILFVGHFHKAEVMPHHRNVCVVQSGCVEDQSRFMRGRHLEAHVGGWIVKFMQRPDGSISRFAPEFFKFFDKDYHIKNEGAGGV